jgi:hypothetical protein
MHHGNECARLQSSSRLHERLTPWRTHFPSLTHPALCTPAHYSMKHDLQESSQTHLIQAQDDLMIPSGEFVALLICAVLAISLLFGLPTFASARKNIMVASSRPVLSLKRSNIHSKNEHLAQHPRLQSAEHNPSANKMIAAVPLSCEFKQCSGTKKVGYVE